MGWQEGQMYGDFASNADVCHGSVTITITGGAGAVGTVVGSPGVSAVRTGAGAYNLTFPPSVDCYLQYSIQKSTTVFGCRGIARNAGAGTASFQTYIANGTLTDPAAADEISIYFFARTSSA